MKRYLLCLGRGIYEGNPDSNVWTEFLSVFAKSKEDAIRFGKEITGEDFSEAEIHELEILEGVDR